MVKFCYLGSILSKDGKAETDMKTRIDKARQHNITLNNVWHSSHLSTFLKLRIFNSNVKPVLLYDCETWKLTKSITDRLQAFVNKSLRRIFKIFWTNLITNQDLVHLAEQKAIKNEIQRKKWSWIGHTLRKSDSDIAKMAMEWNPQGHQKKERPRKTWRITVERKHLYAGKFWVEVKRLVQGRGLWRGFVESLVPLRAP